MASHLLLVCVAVLLVALQNVDSCTTFVITAGASADGSVMAAHSADGGANTDPRLVRIPGQSFPEGTKRPIYGSPESYPRYVGDDPRAPGQIPQYLSDNCDQGANYCKDFEPLGEIPQVASTFSYYEAVYGVMNEHQVGISESTCSAVFSTKARGSGGKALFSVNALSQIAMERASTAREAVQIMGDLSQQHGFYGASDSFEGGGESLIVTDKTEGWVFHVLADPTGESSIWVGARVPDGHAAVVANMYSVRDVDLSDTSNFLGRQDMWKLAEDEGLYQSGDAKDFTATFSDGEYAHKYYSGRRMWGVFRLLAGGLNLPANYDNLKEDAPYPFSVPVEVTKTDVTPALMFTVMRDYYNDTAYSLGGPSNRAAGPFGTIDRFGGQQSGEAVSVQGSWERSIALYRTAESYIVQSGGYGYNNSSSAASSDNDMLGGVVWFGAHSATYTTYVPVLSGGILEVPTILSNAWQGVNMPGSNFWASRSLAMLAQVRWAPMMVAVRDMQHLLEEASQAMVTDVYDKYRTASASVQKAAAQDVQQLMWQHIAAAPTASAELFQSLLFRYADGFDNQWKGEGDDRHFSGSGTGYPGWWLEMVGYPRGPPPP